MLQRFYSFITLILDTVSAEVNDFIKPALTVTALLRQMVDNPKLDLLTQLSKPKWDDETLAKIRAVLDEALVDLGFIQEANETKECIIAQFIDYQKNEPTCATDAIWHKLASTIACRLSGDTMKQHEADFLTQMVYSQTK
jgi:hypothetical protein